MKRLILPFLALTIILSSCSSAKKLLSKARYDAAMQKAAKKIRKDPSNFKEVDIFTQAYNTANRLDESTLTSLKASGDPSNYNQIYSIYETLEKRQQLAKSLPTSIGVNFNFKDINQEMYDFKNKTVEYDYAKGVKLLQENDRQKARQAYQYFVDCKNLNSNYKDIDTKINQAKFLGTDNVIFTRKNSSGVPLPANFFNALSSMNLNNLNKEWLNFDSQVDTSLFYDYEVQLNITSIAVSPGKIVEKPITQSKKIQDGFQYELDANGNVKKDSLGNDIKHPKYKNIYCQLMDKDKQKVAHVQGDLLFINKRTGETIKIEKAAADALFEDHSYKIVSGNTAALSDQARQLLNKPEAPFPTDPALLLQASQTLKGICQNLIDKDAGVFQ